MNYNLLSIINGTKVLESAGDVATVCIMGIGIVFIGLVCIILLCTILAAIFKNVGNNAPATNKAIAADTASLKAEPIENKQEFVAAISAAIAEDLGTDISAIRIKSIKKLG